MYNWRTQARKTGQLLPNGHATPAGWTSVDKFAAVLETAAMNEAELSAYCRSRGLYAEQIQQWRLACEQANDWDQAQTQHLKSARKDDKQTIGTLQKELLRKDKALAETAVLLVLRKKAQAIWGDEDE